MVSKLYGISQYRCACGQKFRWEPELRRHQKTCRPHKTLWPHRSQGGPRRPGRRRRRQTPTTSPTAAPLEQARHGRKAV